MGLAKVTYEDNVTVIGAANLNAIQDEIIANAAAISEKYEKPSGGIPKTDLASDVKTSLSNADTAVQPETGKGLSSNDYTTTEKTKLSGIAEGAEVNQNAFSSVIVGSTTIAADSKTDSLTLIAGSNVTLTPDATNDSVTISATGGGTTYDEMTETEAKTGTSTTAKVVSAKVIDAAITNKGYTSNAGTITGITMNGASKGTSGVVDLGTVLTSHQDISGKADKSATVSNVSYDSDSKKLKQTINGTSSDIVTVATLKAAMNLVKADVGLGNVDNTSDVNKPISTAMQTALNAKADASSIPFATPEKYGAAGNGTTDDSSAIAAASAAGPVFGDKNKTYYIGTSCTISGDLYNCHFKINKNVSLIFENETGLSIIGCEFENDEYEMTTRGQWMLIVKSSDNVFISGNYFHKGVSVLYVNRCTNLIVTDNIFEDILQISDGGNGYGVLLIESKNVTISNNIFKNVMRHSVYISKDDTSSFNEDIVISNNIFKWDASDDKWKYTAVTSSTFDTSLTYYERSGSAGAYVYTASEDTAFQSGKTYYTKGSGYETTINIRPSKRVSITNNQFIDMFGICSINVQSMSVNNGSETIVAGSKDVYIANNVGSFKDSPRYNLSGVIYFSGGVADEYITNVVIKGNHFKIDHGALVTPSAVDGLFLTGNEIEYGVNLASAVLWVQGNQNWTIQNFYIERNVIKNASALFIATTARPFGDLKIVHNVIDVKYLAQVTASGSSFNDVEILSNVVKVRNNSTTFNNASYHFLTVHDNTVHDVSTDQIVDKIVELNFSPQAQLGIEFIVQPQDASVTNGSVVSFFAAVNSLNGVTYKYEWQYKYNGVWTAFIGSALPVLTKTAQSAWNGWSIRCVVRYGDNYAKNITSREVTLTVTSQS